VKRLSAILILCCATSVFGAAGDYVGAQIDSSGWQLWLQFNGMATNGTFALGLATNNTVTGTQSVRLSLTSQGFEESALNENVFPRTIAAASFTVEKGIARSF
jgi:hypothetical protein